MHRRMDAHVLPCLHAYLLQHLCKHALTQVLIENIPQFLVVPLSDKSGLWHDLGRAFHPFAWRTWGCIMASLLAISTVLFLVEVHAAHMYSTCRICTIAPQAAQPEPPEEFFRSLQGLLTIMGAIVHGFFGCSTQRSLHLCMSAHACQFVWALF